MLFLLRKIRLSTALMIVFSCFLLCVVLISTVGIASSYKGSQALLKIEQLNVAQRYGLSHSVNQLISAQLGLERLANRLVYNDRRQLEARLVTAGNQLIDAQQGLD